MNKNIIPVAFATDENYAMPLSVAMTSLLENANENTHYDINILIKLNFSQENTDLIFSLKEKYKCDITFINIDKTYENIEEIAKSTTNYLDEINKCIYLNHNVVVQKDLTELFKIDLENNTIGGVRQIDDEINSSVLLIDCDKVRKNEIKIGEIDLKFNLQAYLLKGEKSFNFSKQVEIKSDLVEKFDKKQLKSALRDNVIFSYTDDVNPFKSSDCSFEYEWDKYCKKTPFRNDRKGLNKTPKLSVIIPVYNAEKYLEESINSVINQTLLDFEIICVDDGSTDNSLEILEELAKNNSNIVLLQQQNKYAGVARNNGLRVATGEYVYFFDCDDIIYDNTVLENMYKNAKRNDVDILRGKSVTFDDKSGETIDNDYFSLKNIPDSYFNRILNLEKDCKIIFTCSNTPWGGICRREFLIENCIEFPDLISCNDTSFYVETVLKAKSILISDINIVKYRINNSNSLVSVRFTHFDVVLSSYNIIENLCKGYPTSVVYLILNLHLSSVIRWLHESNVSEHYQKNIDLCKTFFDNANYSYWGGKEKCPIYDNFCNYYLKYSNTRNILKVDDNEILKVFILGDVNTSTNILNRINLVDNCDNKFKVVACCVDDDWCTKSYINNVPSIDLNELLAITNRLNNYIVIVDSNSYNLDDLLETLDKNNIKKLFIDSCLKNQETSIIGTLNSLQYFNNTNSTLIVNSPPITGNSTLTTTLINNNVKFINILNEPQNINYLKGYDKIKIITAIREPIIQNLSYIFQELSATYDNVFNESLRKRFKNKEQFLSELTNVNTFLDQYINKKSDKTPNMYLDAYFDEFNSNFINLFEYEFDKEKGYTIIKKDNIEVFVYQYEKIDEIAKEMSNWIGQTKFETLSVENDFNSNWITNQYNQALEYIDFSDKYFNYFYGTLWVKHFYSQNDIEKFKDRWNAHIKGTANKSLENTKIIHFSGGLANQILQYIFLRYLEVIRGEKNVLVDDTFYKINNAHNGFEIDKIFPNIKLDMLKNRFNKTSWKKIVDTIVETKYNKKIPDILLSNGLDIKFVVDERFHIQFDRGYNFAGDVYKTHTDVVYDKTSTLYNTLKNCNNVYYMGCWITEKYAKEIKSTIASELKFRELVDSENIAYKKDIISQKASVGIHVRRGDFVKLGWDKPIENYSTAINKLKEELKNNVTIQKV